MLPDTIVPEEEREFMDGLDDCLQSATRLRPGSRSNQDCTLHNRGNRFGSRNRLLRQPHIDLLIATARCTFNAAGLLAAKYYTHYNPGIAIAIGLSYLKAAPPTR